MSSLRLGEIHFARPGFRIGKAIEWTTPESRSIYSKQFAHARVRWDIAIFDVQGRLFFRVSLSLR
jgi:hypothetical protein